MKTRVFLGIVAALTINADPPGGTISGGTFSRPSATFSRPAAPAVNAGGQSTAIVSQGAPFGNGFSPVVRAPNSWWYFQGLPPGFPIDRVNLNPRHPYLAGYYANLAHGYNQLIHQYPHLAPLVAQLANENPYLNNIGAAGYFPPYYGLSPAAFPSGALSAPYADGGQYPSYDLRYFAPQYNYIFPGAEGGTPMPPPVDGVNGPAAGAMQLPENTEQPLIVNLPPGARIRKPDAPAAAAPVSAPAPAPKKNPIVTAER